MYGIHHQSMLLSRNHNTPQSVHLLQNRLNRMNELYPSNDVRNSQTPSRKDCRKSVLSVPFPYLLLSQENLYSFQFLSYYMLCYSYFFCVCCSAQHLELRIFRNNQIANIILLAKVFILFYIFPSFLNTFCFFTNTTPHFQQGKETISIFCFSLLKQERL